MSTTAPTTSGDMEYFAAFQSDNAYLECTCVIDDTYRIKMALIGGTHLMRAWFVSAFGATQVEAVEEAALEHLVIISNTEACNNA